jgi:Zn-dependent protease
MNGIFLEKKEIFEYILAIFVLTFIFSFEGSKFVSTNMTRSFFAVVTAFLLHEIAHKYVASKLGYYARFHFYFPSAILAFLLVFTGVKVAAIGYITLYPYKFKSWMYRRLKISLEEVGKIALVGPAVNIFLAYVSFFLGFSFFKDVNKWFALFNLLPIPPLDGSKVLHWKLGGWAFFFALTIILMII